MKGVEVNCITVIQDYCNERKNVEKLLYWMSISTAVNEEPWADTGAHKTWSVNPFKIQPLSFWLFLLCDNILIDVRQLRILKQIKKQTKMFSYGGTSRASLRHCSSWHRLQASLYPYLLFNVSEVYISRILQIIQMFSKPVFTKVLVTATHGKSH